MFWSPSRDLQAQAEVMLQSAPEEQTVIEQAHAATNQFDQTIGKTSPYLSLHPTLHVTHMRNIFIILRLVAASR